MQTRKIRDMAARAGGILLMTLLAGAPAFAQGWREPGRNVLVLTSTNDPHGNQVLVFQMQQGDSPALSLAQTLPTGGKGGAGANAGAVQFKGEWGAVANDGTNSVTQLARDGDAIFASKVIRLAAGCVSPDSVALAHRHLFVVGANCAQSYEWPSGAPAGSLVHLTDSSAAQIVVGKNWGAITFTSGALAQLGLRQGALDGFAAPVALPDTANAVPLGAGFWGNVLGFTPAHSADSFAIVDAQRDVYPIAGPTPAFPANAPCWVAKGPGNVWYTGNTPGHSISIFFSDDKGGAFYKSVPLPGAPTDLTVSRDQRWLAVIYAAGGSGYVAVYRIDAYGGLTLEATSAPIGVASFNGVAISE